MNPVDLALPLGSILLGFIALVVFVRRDKVVRPGADASVEACRPWQPWDALLLFVGVCAIVVGAYLLLAKVGYTLNRLGYGL